MALLGGEKFLGDEVERVVPGNGLELAGAFRPLAAQRMQQAVLVVLALGVARDLGADDAGGVVVVLGAAHAADGALVEELDLERAGRRAIVRAGGKADPLRSGQPDGLVHGRQL